jgi:DNA modification methylase
LVRVELLHGDCVELMRAMPECSVDSIVTDPPYGLEFMGKEWDKLGWQSGGGFSKPGIGKRQTDWVSFSSTSRYGAANPTCGVCGGRARGKKRCECEEPQWKPIGKRRNPENEGLPDDVTGGGMSAQMTAMQRWHYEWAAEALRVLKPGGHLLAFGGTRTYHRMACAIEDAGFEIRDSIHWVYGSGFPKSHNIGKNVDKHLSAERVPTGEVRKGGWRPGGNGGNLMNNAGGGLPDIVETAPATDEARRWEGWGTALKPAHEPVVVARKPLSGTVAGNVLTWGTGGLNIDGCRVGTTVETWPKSRSYPFGGDVTYGSKDAPTESTQDAPSGRWPANIVLDGAAAAALDQQSGEASYNPKGTFGRQRGNQPTDTPAPFAVRKDGDGVFGYGDRGGASRFFTQADFGPDDWPFVYQAKPSKRERNAGLDGMEAKPTGDTGSPISNRKCRKCGLVRFAQPHCTCAEPEWEEASRTANANYHPTVKPVALMRHLVRLVTPPGGTVLDPFAGSGTTLVAAVLEGMHAIGCEMTDEYLPIIRGRVAWAEEQVFVREELAKAQPEQPTLL